MENVGYVRKIKVQLRRNRKGKIFIGRGWEGRSRWSEGQGLVGKNRKSKTCTNKVNQMSAAQTNTR